MDFGDDVVGIINYIIKRLEKSDITAIINLSNELISPYLYALLHEAQPTSICVERSFSMLKKLMANDRNFDVGGIKKYFIVYFNKKACDEVNDDISTLI
jgi:hypothetical protein